MSKLSTVFRDKRFYATLFGNVYEFYDFIVYAFLSGYIAQLFFPQTASLPALLSTFGVFASGYLTRPIGALFFGYIGDKKGRKLALVLSICLITLSTVMIGLLPTYESVGLMAPLLLMGCRLLQGFAVSGEEAGAAVYLSEVFGQDKKGFVGAAILGSAYFGVLVGSLVVGALLFYFTESEIKAYAWRLPFLFSLILGIIALKARLSIVSEEVGAKKNPITELWRQHRRDLFGLTLMTASLCIPIYLATVFLPTYLTVVQGFSLQQSMALTSCELIFLSIGVPIFGAISDKVGYQPIFLMGCCGLIVLAKPIFNLLTMHDLLHVFYGMLGLGVIVFFVAGPLFALLIDSFKKEVRFTGVSFVFNVSMSLFGSTTPLVALSLIAYFQDPTSPWMVMAFSGVLGLIGFFSPKTNRLLCSTLCRINTR